LDARKTHPFHLPVYSSTSPAGTIRGNFHRGATKQGRDFRRPGYRSVRWYCVRAGENKDGQALPLFIDAANLAVSVLFLAFWEDIDPLFLRSQAIFRENSTTVTRSAFGFGRPAVGYEDSCLRSQTRIEATGLKRPAKKPDASWKSPRADGLPLRSPTHRAKSARWMGHPRGSGLYSEECRVQSADRCGADRRGHPRTR